LCGRGRGPRTRRARGHRSGRARRDAPRRDRPPNDALGLRIPPRDAAERRAPEPEPPRPVVHQHDDLAASEVGAAGGETHERLVTDEARTHGRDRRPVTIEERDACARRAREEVRDLVEGDIAGDGHAPSLPRGARFAHGPELVQAAIHDYSQYLDPTSSHAPDRRQAGTMPALVREAAWGWVE